MYVGPPPGPASARLRAARTLAGLASKCDRHDDDTMIARRVKSLRNQVESGTYRVDPTRLAASMYVAMIAGGL
jgi:anti-sigma28 factor (negative regulator of flagellin synthesis)